ncbi:DUF29 domain-containing protein [Aphanothece sacrum]|uniref:DUF29 domain-containing protein n=1 Tax=Aphanothece sacrum FPU1 TaxID=1920663 RepID=A0A401IFI1_APHSA|nr:DUF29 domain-containing protein [Aphanothece sacrum]GBF80043.1 hypothetical protein AsFPU1_1444 [Aphanothece sacrum FPU1]GBF84586.1 hypothetical protein AsFPU3_1638 [Aphanothece sacrum FPU3]
MKTYSIQTQLKALYEQDEHLWLTEMVKLLKENRLNELDIENLIEELEDLGKRDKNKVESLLRQIIIHLLLLQYWTEEYEYNYRHWQGEIATFRIQLNRALTTNLKKYLLENQEDIYQEAVFIVTQKTGLSINIFPSNSPYSLEQLLNKDWLPEKFK